MKTRDELWKGMASAMPLNAAIQAALQAAEKTIVAPAPRRLSRAGAPGKPGFGLLGWEGILPSLMNACNRRGGHGFSR